MGRVGHVHHTGYAASCISHTGDFESQTATPRHCDTAIRAVHIARQNIVETRGIVIHR